MNHSLKRKQYLDMLKIYLKIMGMDGTGTSHCACNQCEAQRALVLALTTERIQEIEQAIWADHIADTVHVDFDER